MELIFNELKQHIVKKVDDLSNKKLKYLLVLYKKDKTIYSLVYIKNSNSIDIIHNNKNISYISPLTKLEIIQLIPIKEIYELEYNFDFDKFNEIKENIIKQINNAKFMKKQIYNYVNPEIYYMISICNFSHKYGAMSIRSSI